MNAARDPDGPFVVKPALRIFTDLDASYLASNGHNMLYK